VAKNPLTSSKTPGIIVSEIRLMLPTSKKVHFLVEGEEDSRFWKPRVSNSAVSIVNCEGKPNLFGATDLLMQSELKCISGIYDPDFDRLMGVEFRRSILAQTDANDLELTLMLSDALSLVLSELADEALLSDFENASGSTVIDHLERVSRHFGELRFLNRILDHRVDFDKLSPYRFVSNEQWELDLTGLRSEYAALSGVPIEVLPTLISSHCPQGVAWQLSQGHDTLRILACGLRQRIGKRQIKEKDLLGYLRVGYSLELLKASRMYGELTVLEQNLPAPIFDR